MSLYCGIDLHLNNHLVCVIDEHGKRLFEKKFTNEAV